MNYFSSNSWNCFFSYANSEVDILYDTLEIGPFLSIKSIEN